MSRTHETDAAKKSKRLFQGAMLVAIAGVLCGIALLPVETKQGVDFKITSRRMPLAVKVAEFLLRDREYRRISKEITRGLTTDDERVLAVFEWTREHILPIPRGWPAVDDHILNIIIRGYGGDDQMADVFATLTTYAGIPAFWKIVRAREGGGVIVLSFAKINGQWTAWDVERGLIFRHANGRLASVPELATASALVRLVAGDVVHGDQNYHLYVEDELIQFSVPETLRAYEQMPGRRVLIEMKHVWRGLRSRMASSIHPQPILVSR